MGTVGAFAPPPAVYVPALTGDGEGISPSYPSASLDLPLASTGSGWVTTINNFDTTGLAQPYSVNSGGVFTIPASPLAPTGSCYVLAGVIIANGPGTMSSDATVAMTNCTVTKTYFFSAVGGSVAIFFNYITPVNNTMPCTFLPQVAAFPGETITMNNAWRLGPGFVSTLPERAGDEKPTREELAKLKRLLRLLRQEDYCLEDESGGKLLPCEVEERLRRVLEKHGAEKPVFVPEVSASRPKLATLSVEDFDVVASEGGGLGLKKADVRLALERAAWERRLQRGEGLAWRVDGDSKSPAS